MSFGDAVVGVRYSVTAAFWPTMKGAMMAILSALVAFRLVPNAPQSLVVELIGFAAFTFFSCATLFGVWRVLGTPGDVVSITDRGIRDLRIAPEEIPWTAVRSLSTWQFRRTLTLALDVDPEFEKTLHLTRMVRWVRDANAGMGVRGLCITTQGLEMGHNELLRECDRRFRRAQESTRATPPG